MSTDDVKTLCYSFTDRFCATTVSARRYLVVFNHVFHRVWKMVPAPLKMSRTKRKVHNLQELDDRLSQSTSGHSSRGRENAKHDYFDSSELARLREAAKMGPQGMRDHLG